MRNKLFTAQDPLLRMKRLSLFEQRPIVQKFNHFFKAFKEDKSFGPLFKIALLEGAIAEKNAEVFWKLLDSLYAQGKASREFVLALSEINKLWFETPHGIYGDALQHIRNAVEKEMKSLEEKNPFDEPTESNLLDGLKDSDSSWRSPAVDKHPRTHTPFGSGDDESEKKLAM